jgi:hypothetical protein
MKQDKFKEEWVVVYNRKEVIKKFRTVWAAKYFLRKHNKDYFDLLELFSEDYWNYIKEEQKDVSRGNT